jgi:Cu-processing system ATP-binding protein
MFDSLVLIMDEPTNGLDPLALQRLKTLLREEKAKGKLLLITTHIMSFVEEMAEEIVFLLEGDVHFQGSLKSLLENHRAANLENATAQILQHRTGYGLNGRGGEIETPSLRRHWRAWPAKNHSHA